MEKIKNRIKFILGVSIILATVYFSVIRRSGSDSMRWNTESISKFMFYVLIVIVVLILISILIIYIRTNFTKGTEYIINNYKKSGDKVQFKEEHLKYEEKILNSNKSLNSINKKMSSHYLAIASTYYYFIEDLNMAMLYLNKIELTAAKALLHFNVVLYKTFVLLEQRKLDKVESHIQTLEHILKGEDDYSILLKAYLAYYRADKEKMKKEYEKIVESKSLKIRMEYHYLSAIYYKEIDDIERVKDILDHIIENDEGNVVKNKAIKLLAKFNNN